MNETELMAVQALAALRKKTGDQVNILVGLEDFCDRLVIRLIISLAEIDEPKTLIDLIGSWKSMKGFKAVEGFILLKVADDFGAPAPKHPNLRHVSVNPTLHLDQGGDHIRLVGLHQQTGGFVETLNKRHGLFIFIESKRNELNLSMEKIQKIQDSWEIVNKVGKYFLNHQICFSFLENFPFAGFLQSAHLDLLPDY